MGHGDIKISLVSSYLHFRKIYSNIDTSLLWLTNIWISRRSLQTPGADLKRALVFIFVFCFLLITNQNGRSDIKLQLKAKDRTKIYCETVPEGPSHNWCFTCWTPKLLNWYFSDCTNEVGRVKITGPFSSRYLFLSSFDYFHCGESNKPKNKKEQETDSSRLHCHWFNYCFCVWFHKKWQVLN